MKILPRILALFLSLAIGLPVWRDPNPAFALRQENSEEAAGAEGQLKLALADSSPVKPTAQLAAIGRLPSALGVPGVSPVLQAAAGAEEKVLQGHSFFVRAVAFSPDGKYLVSGEENRNLILWDVSSGKEIWRFSTSKEGPANQKGFSGVVFSPDGKRIAATLFDGTLLLIDAAAEAPKEENIERRTFQHQTWEKSWAVAFSPTGEMVVSAGRAGLQFWPVQPIQPSLSRIVPGEFFSVAFSPDGKQLAAGTAGDIHLLDASGQLVSVLEDKQMGEVNSVAFSPDGKTVASGDGRGSTMVWSIEAGSSKVLNRTGYPVRSVAFSPDGTHVASGDLTGAVRLLPFTPGLPAVEFKGHTGIVHSVAFSPDAKLLASGSADKTVRLWSVPEFPAARPAGPLKAGAEENPMSVQIVGRVKAELGKIKISSTAVIGIGPSEAERYAGVLGVISQLLDESVRRQMFVVSRTADQGLYLKSLGLAASDQPVDVVNQLKSRFGETALRADYHADDAETAVFKDAVALMGANIEIIRRATQAELRNFLQELLAAFAGISPQSVPDRFNLDQLTSDINLLIKA